MSTPIEVEVPLARSPYKVLVGPGLLKQCGPLIAASLKPRACAVLTDSNVAPLHAAPVEESLREAGFKPVRVILPAGESSKSFEQTAQACDAMIAAGLDRSSMLIALGGGVVGDLAGFVSAIYYRGIPCVQIPTTIVSQVDSSVGGKTGINAPGGKNLIGSFHQPRLVIADTDTLRTLPSREFHEGFAEVIKHAAIRDPDMLDAADGLDSIAPLIARNVAIKAAIVADDEFETRGLRALLNFGHTIGHGIENAAGYGRLFHGEAISLGLVAACRLSVEKAGLPQEQCERVIEALRHHNLPLQLPADITTESIIAALHKDKKFVSGAIRFVLLRELGDAYVSDAVGEKDILRAIEALR